MLPTQILLNNFLYDLAQVTIPTDNVDEEYMRRPQRWDIRLIRNFMLFIGPISSIYDFPDLLCAAAFFPRRAGGVSHRVVCRVAGHANAGTVRDPHRRKPWRSRPSGALTATTLAIVLLGILIPFTPLAKTLGFTVLPASYFAFLAAATATYLLLVEIAKRKLFPVNQSA